jgi:hypothetical protein
MHATTLYNSFLFSITRATITIPIASGHGTQCWWGPCLVGSMHAIASYYYYYYYTILYCSRYHYYYYCWWPWQAMLVVSTHAITLYDSILFSTILTTTSIATASGHGKQCWWGPCMPLLPTLNYSLQLYTTL